MGNLAYIPTHGTPPAVVNLAVMRAENRIDVDGDLARPPASPAETSGPTPEVSLKATPDPLRPRFLERKSSICRSPEPAR